MKKTATPDPIYRDSLSDQAYVLLRGRIERRELTPGTRLSEDELALELRISKTPLRMAIHRLQQDGIVQILPRRGIYVSTLTPEEILQVIEVREALEGLCARLAAQRATPKLIDRLRACFQGFPPDELESRKRAYASADHRFHTLLVEASGNQQAIRMMELLNLRIQMYRLRTVALMRRDALLVHEEHEEILAALEAGDGARAERVIRAHIRQVRENVAEELLNDTGPDRSVSTG